MRNKKSCTVTILVENTVGVSKKIIGEWGLSMFIETPGGQAILYDTGANNALLNNARQLGVDLDQLSKIILSHGHYDHTGGLRCILEYLKRPIEIIAHPQLFAPHYVKKDARLQYAGIPYNQLELESLGGLFRFSEKPIAIEPGLFTSGEIPRKSSPHSLDHRLALRKEGELLPDPVADDLSLYLSTSKGLVVLLGCAHAGLENIIEHGRKLTEQHHIHAIIGGTHLNPLPESEKVNQLAYLQSVDPDLIAANHCTGMEAMAELYTHFKSGFRFASTGAVFSLPIDD